MKFDSLMFDMDGTLWDAVDTYCAVWNFTLAETGVENVKVDREQLVGLMGTPLREIVQKLFGDKVDVDTFLSRLELNEKAFMPRFGGRIYPEVKETIEKLSDSGMKLFMVSNCSPYGLPTFLEFTGMKQWFTDTISYGETGKDKDVNISILIERYNLKSPLYIGDTVGDAKSAHLAGVPFAWAKYGFGRGIDNAEYELEKISDLLTITM